MMEVAEKVVFDKVNINLYSKKNPVEVPVLENKIITSGKSPNFIRHITFDVSGTLLENNIVCGQSIGVLPPGFDHKGKPHKLRLYSVSSPSKGEDGNGKLYSTTVKRLIDENWNSGDLFTGVCSNYLASLKPGDTVRLTGPSGKRFLLPKNATDFNYVFFATGTGIAPFRGMVKELFDKGMTNDVVLIFGCPYRTDFLYEDYFNSIANKYSNFNYLVCVSREEKRRDGSPNYVQCKLIDESPLLNPILEKENTLVYICGLKGMEYDIYRNLAVQGFDSYLNFKKQMDANPANWSWKDIKSNVKPAERVFVETY